MDRQFNLVEVIEATIKWFKPIAIISLLVLVGTLIITSPKLKIIEPKFESTTVFFPANLSLTDRPYVFESQDAVDVELNLFGDKHDVDRLISIALSGPVMNHLIDKFNLIEHYEIDPNKVKYPLSAATHIFKKNFRAFKNEYESAEIHVTDKNNVLAAEMANEAVAKIDEINKSMIMDGRNRMIEILQKHIAAKKSELDKVSGQIAETNGGTKSQQVTEELLTKQLLKYANILDQYQLITSDNITTLHVMEKAYPAEKQDSKRWLIVIGAFLVTLFLLILAATVIHVFSK